MAHKRDPRWNPKADLFPAQLTPEQRARDLERGAAAEIIRNKVLAAGRRLGLQAADCDDLIQLLSLHLWQRSDHFDPDRGSWPTFSTVVVDRRLLELLKQKRDVLTGAQQGLDERNLHEDRRRPSSLALDRERAEQRWDVDSIISDLPGEQQKLCRRVQQDGPTEAARELGMPRQTLVDRLRRLKQQFKSLNPFRADKNHP